MFITRRIATILVCCALAGHTTGIYAMNLTQLKDIPLKPPYNPASRSQWSMLAERGIASQAYNEDESCTNVLRIWNPNQNALAMLKGFPANSAITELLDAIDANDDGTRGHLIPSADLDLRYSVSFASRFFFNHYLSIAGYLPIYSMRLRNMSWCDLTKDVSEQDARVREELTSKIGQILSQYGQGLSLSNWTRTGLGDLNILLESVQDFEQAKPFLKNVQVNWRTGLTLPTGLKQDPDKIFALPFGYDGSVGVIFGGGINLDLGDYFNAGFDIELLHLFGSERIRRVKTYPDQTDLLLLEKVCAYKDWGLTQRINLFATFANFFKGLSLKADYQFLKQGDSRLSIGSPAVATSIANTAVSLQEWTSHIVVAKVGYDFGYHLGECPRARPQLWVYGRVPFDGKKAATFTTVGIIGAVEF